MLLNKEKVSDAMIRKKTKILLKCSSHHIVMNIY